jgi:hypothetical protein
MAGVERFQRIEEVFAIRSDDPEAQAALRGWTGAALGTKFELPVGQTLVRAREDGNMYWVPDEEFAKHFMRVVTPDGE